jgi:hypothetical protein
MPRYGNLPQAECEGAAQRKASENRTPALAQKIASPARATYPGGYTGIGTSDTDAGKNTPLVARLVIYCLWGPPAGPRTRLIESSTARKDPTMHARRLRQWPIVATLGAVIAAGLALIPAGGSH